MNQTLPRNKSREWAAKKKMLLLTPFIFKELKCYDRIREYIINGGSIYGSHFAAGRG